MFSTKLGHASHATRRGLYAIIGGLSLTAVSLVHAQEPVKVATENLARMGLVVEQTRATSIEGLLEVTTNQGVFYVSPDGNKLLSGRIFDITGAQPVDETAASLAQMRQQDLAQVADSVIEFTAPNEKHVVSVFTDTSCGYCRQLHENIDAYLEAGITIRYLAFPRNGMSSPAAETLARVWCAADPQAALATAKQDRFVKSTECDAPIAKHFALGQKFGVRGTPAFVTESGDLLPGLRLPPDLIAEIERLAAQR